MLGTNLYAPLPGDQGAHGSFDYKAIGWSPQTIAIQHRSAVKYGLGAIAAIVALAAVNKVRTR